MTSFIILLRHVELYSSDEQNTKAKLRDIMAERAKLIETVTQQDGIVRGLESERSRWSRDLADRTSSLAQEKSSLAAQAEKMREELEASRKNEQLIKIKEKEIDAVNNQVRDLKLKSSQYQARLKESQENCAQLEGRVKNT